MGNLRERNIKGQFVSDGEFKLINCLYCGKEISVSVSRLENGRGKYCSRQCLGKATVSGKIGPWKAKQEIPKLDIPDTQLAYIAGFVDGEGYIGIAKHQAGGKRLYYSPQISVYNSDPDILFTLQKWTGVGSILIHNRLDRPVYHKIGLIWRISGMKARSLLISLLPFLQIKKQQAELAIKCPNDGHLRNNEAEQVALQEAIKILNHRGQNAITPT